MLSIRGYICSRSRLSVVALALVLSLGGCSEVTEIALPDGVIGPSTYHNRQGAIRLTQATVNELSTAIRDHIILSGLLTDELTPSVVIDGSPNPFDLRSGPVTVPPHSVRSLARLARGVINKYVTGETGVWRAQLFIYEAYATILTADGWCSGVPLSTLDFEADWTYKAGSTTDDIYEHAITLLDSGLSQSAGDLSMLSTIRILKARALIALGRYSEADETVQNIDANFLYAVRVAFDGGTLRPVDQQKYHTFLASASISDTEGVNGIPYRSSNDPRTLSNLVIFSNSNSTAQSYFPTKYLTGTDSSIFILASGIEAKLIQAEANLHSDNPQQMLDILNDLRTDGSYTVDTVQLPGGGERIDTAWNKGIGGVDGLRFLSQMPASEEEQRTLLFTERANWLFLTGARQADLRRLVRKYNLDRDAVYPTGIYTPSPIAGAYGNDIYFGLHTDEFRNPLFKGCLNEN